MENLKSPITNFKTMKRSILGKYDQLKYVGMVWTGRLMPIYINFDLSKSQNEYTEKFINAWKPNNNKQKEELTFRSKNQPLIERLISQAEEISKKISVIVNRADQNDTGNNEQDFNNDLNALKMQRRNIWKQIEEEESKTNLAIPLDESQNQDSLLDNLSPPTKNILKESLTDDFVEKYSKSEKCQNQNAIEDLLNEECQTDVQKAEEKNQDEKIICNEKEEDQSKCNFSESGDNFIIKSPKSETDDFSDFNLDSSPNKIQIDEEKEKVILDIMSNVFHCGSQKNSTTLSMNEKLLITKIVDNPNDSFALKKNSNDLMSNDLCYLIPGAIMPGLTIIIFIYDDRNEKMNSYLANAIEQKIMYLKKNCQIPAEKIIDFHSDVATTSCILTNIFKNEIQFLYTTFDAIESNIKLISVLNVSRSRNNLMRMIFIIQNDLNESTEKVKTITEKIKDAPLLIILNGKSDMDLNNFSIPPENVFYEEKIYLTQNQDKEKSIKKIKKNLFLEVMYKKSSLLTKNIENLVKWLNTNHYVRCDGKEVSTGIIFSLTIRDAESINAYLNKNGIPTAFFHSKMNELQQKEVIKNWLSDIIKVVVIANPSNNQLKNKISESQEISFENESVSLYRPFSVKQDVRFIIHYSIPQSIADYIDQINIAGNDGFISHSLIMFNEIDVKIMQRMISFAGNKASSDNSQENPEIGYQDSMENDFKAIVDYCSIDDDERIKYCRREEIMKYYGLNFNYKNCCCMCDECEKRSKIEEIKIDATKHANNMLKIIKNLSSSKHHKSTYPTLKNVIDIYIGKNRIESINGIEGIEGCSSELKENKKILLIKTIKEMCDRNILKLSTKKTPHGNIHYFEVDNDIDIIDPIFV